jgi:hypothetical protein
VSPLRDAHRHPFLAFFGPEMPISTLSPVR